ncbi:uncharacterized protein AMSG_05791 [Thecamonas trahens ATCC 50062]|uniref:Uncharacterized protein n=1 Tax=Thecamonas trahens ATCC 50062 TaxID=461836 RepID=A0A0L0DCH1_THETB|nr:hypothetical protein AMSG_05791 [Thecamonas trahens ATCC 50062]KNC50032.1 hypothetical protein AMSG_05791 [Thecamonas trahens ATCC 50062]|eukprot:XP_013757199.1 hypothetical protein AMSG_05791 [Thecamonas trahens ATCC 50062]
MAVPASLASAHVTSASWAASVSASSESGSMTGLTVSHTLTVTVSMALASAPDAVFTVSGKLEMTASLPLTTMPLAYLAELELPFHGKLELTGTSGATGKVLIVDTHPTDGQLPLVLIHATTPTSSGAVAASTATIVANALAQVPSDTIPSWMDTPLTLFASLRAGFVSTGVGAPVVVASGELVRSASETVPGATIYAAHAECLVGGCSVLLESTLASAITQTGTGADAAAVVSTLDSVFAVSATSIIPVSVSATTVAVGDKVGIVLRAATSLDALAPAWPTAIVELSPELLLGMGRGLQVRFSGSVASVMIGSGADAQRVVPLAPVFDGSSLGGVALPDAALTGNASDVAAIAAQVGEALTATPSLAPMLAEFINTRLVPASGVDGLVDAYLAATLTPSFNGFWAWFTGPHTRTVCAASQLEHCYLQFRAPLAGETTVVPTLEVVLAGRSLSAPLPATCTHHLNATFAAGAAALTASVPAVAGFGAPGFVTTVSQLTLAQQSVYLAGTMDLVYSGAPAWKHAPKVYTSIRARAVDLVSTDPTGAALYTAADVACTNGGLQVESVSLSTDASSAGGFSWASLAQGKVATNKVRVSSAGASALASSLSAASTELATAGNHAWATSEIGPTSLVLGASMLSVLEALENAVAGKHAHDAKDMVAVVAAALDAAPGGLGAQVTVELTGTAGAPQLAVSVASVWRAETRIQTEAAPWAGVVDLSRVPLHLLLTSELELSTAAPSSVTLAVSGTARVAHFAAPASWQMSAAAVTDGSMHLKLDLPTSSSLSVKCDAKTDGLSGSMASMRVTIEDSDLAAMDNANLVNGTVPLSSDAAVNVVGYPHFPPKAVLASASLHGSGPVASLLPTLSATAPKDIIAALSNTLSSVASFGSGAGSFPLPLVNKGVDALDSVAAALEPILAKLTWAGDLEPELMYATNYAIGVNAPSLPTVECSFSFEALNTGNLARSLLATAEAGLAGCTYAGKAGLRVRDFVAPSVSSVFSQDGQSCAVFSLKPAVPGVVKSFSMKAKSKSHVLSPYTTTWTESSVPVFGRWDDLVVLLAQSGINSLVHLPSSIEVEALSLPSCVPNVPGWAAYFSGVLPGTAFKLGFNATLFDGTTSSVASTMKAGPINVELPASSAQARVDAFVQAEVGIIHGCAPLRSARNISIETAFVNGSAIEDFSTARVPATGGGFQLHAQFVVRSVEPDVPPKSVEVAQYIHLAPGALVSEQLMHALLSQITDVELAGVLGVGVVAPDPVLNPGSPQVEIAINAAINPETQHLVIPYSLSISNITVPGLEYAAPVMSQSRSVVKELVVGLSAATSFEAEATTGTLGPLGLEVGSVTAETSASLVLTAASPWLTTATALKAGTTTSSLFSTFTLEADVSGSAVVGDMHIDALDAPVPGLPHLTINLGVSDSGDLASGAAFEQFKENLQAEATATWSGDDALIRMLKGMMSKDASMCELLKAGVDFLADVKADPSVQAPLAPMKHSPFGRVLGKLLPMYDDTVAAVCDHGEPMSVALFCSFMADAFHYQVGPVCSDVTLAHDMFQLPLTFTAYSYSYTDASVMDTQLFHGGGELAAGVSTSNNLAVSAKVEVALVLDVTFPESGPIQISLNKDETYVRASAGGSDDGQLKLQFGPFSAQVAKSRAWLAATDAVGETAPATLAASPGTGVVLGGSAGFEATVTFPFVDTSQCEISVEVPNLAEPSSATASDAKCADFVSNLESVLSRSWMAEFFSHPGTFFSSFSSEIAKLRAQMFGPDSIIGSKAIAFIDKKLATLFDGELAVITGPAVASQIIHQISVDLVDKLAGIPVSTTVDEIVVEIVTGALNAHLPHLAQPVTVAHDAQARSYTWSIEFGNSALRPLFSVNSDWGAHGLLDLDIQCNAQLEADWTFSIALVYSAVHGVSVTLPVEPAFSSTVDLDMPSGCQLVGGLGPLGFELITTPAETYLKGTLALTLQPKADVDIDISAQLGGSGLLGAGPLIADLAHTTPQEALTAFIHYEASFKAGYEFNVKAGQTSTTPTKLALNDVEMCLGTMLVKYIDAMMGHVTKILDPLNKVFGPKGVLLKPIPGMSKIFGSNFNALRVARYFCELTSDCNINDLVAAVRTYARIMDVVAVADELSSLGVEGCGVSKLLGSFELALHKPVLVPDSYLPPKTKQILYNSAVAQAHEKEIASFVSGVTTSGSFGIEYNILHDPVEKLLDMMMGTNFAIVGVTIPDATLALGMHFPIPIWPFPHVVLSLDFKAALTVSVGEVSLTYDAVYESIHYKNPSYLFRGLGVTYTNPDGSPHYPLIFTASMTGEVSVGVFIFKGYGYAGLQIDVSVRLNNPNGGEVITFDQIARLVKHGNLMHSLDGGIVLTFKYGLGIRACVHLIVVHKCWTVVHWDGSTTLFTHKFNPQSVPAVSSGAGAINLGLVDSTTSGMMLASGELPTYTIDDAGNGMIWFAFVVPGQPVGKALPTRGVPSVSAKVVTFAGSTNGAFRVVPRSSTPVALPSVATAHVELPMAYHAPASGTPTYVASGLKVSAASGAGASLGKTCGSVSLTEPVERASIGIEGAVCPVAVTVSTANNVTISGSLAAYGGHAVTVSGSGGDTLAVEVVTESVRIESSTVLLGKNELSVALGNEGVFSRLRLKGSASQATTFTVAAVPAGTETSAHGGDGDDKFEVADLAALGSLVTVNGAGGDANSLSVTLAKDATFADIMADFVLGGFDSAPSRGVGFGNIQTLNVNVHASASKKSVGLYVAAPVAGTNVNLVGIGGAPSSVLTYDLRGCTKESKLVVTVQGEGSHSVLLGNGAHSLIDYECDIEIVNEAKADVTVHVHAAQDKRALKYAVSDSGVHVTDASGKTDGMQIVFNGPVARALVHFGVGSTVAEHKMVHATTEVLYTSAGAAKLVMASSSAAVVANGTIDVTFGTAGSNKHPLAAIAAPVFVGTASGGSLTLASATGASAPDQWFNFASHRVCEAEAKTATPMRPTVKPTAWAVELAAAAGVPAATDGLPACQLAYGGQPSRYVMSVTTGGGVDGIVGLGVDNVALTASLGDEDDVLEWKPSSDGVAMSPLAASSVAGGDADDVFLVPDLAGIVSMLSVDGNGGVDNVFNVTLASDGLMADVQATNVVGHFGSGPSRAVDYADIQVLNVEMHASDAQRETMVYVATPVAGTNVNVMGVGASAEHELTYDLRGCDESSTLTVYPRGSGFHNIVLGNGGEKLDGYGCKVRVFNEDASDRTVFVHVRGGDDARTMSYAVSDGLIEVTPAAGSGSSFSVEMVGVARARVDFGVGSTAAEHVMASESTEVLYTSAGAAKLVMASSSAAVVANGTIDVTFGTAGSNKHPLAAIAAPVFVGTASGGSLTLASATGASAPDQWFDFASHRVCMAEPQSGVLLRPPTAATAWTMGLAAANGVPAGTDGLPACQLAYSAVASQYVMNITTGGGRDGVLGAKVQNVALSASLGNGIDLLDYLVSGASAPLEVDLGEGVDFANFVGPLDSPTRVAVGADGAADVVVFWAPPVMDSLSPSLLEGDSVVPCGFGRPEPTLVVSQLTTDDAMSLLGGTPDMSTYPWLAGYFGGSPRTINVTTPVGGHLDFDLAGKEVIEVVQLPVSSESTFAAASASHPGEVAKDWVLDIALAAVDEPMSVAVHGVYGGNGTVVLHLPALPSTSASYDVSVHDLGYGGYGRVIVGGLRLTLQHVDVLVLDASSAPGTTVRVADAPAPDGLETALVLLAPHTSILPAEFTFPLVIAGGDVLAQSGAIVSATAPVWLVGETTRVFMDAGKAVDVDHHCVVSAEGVAKNAMPSLVVIDVVVGELGVSSAAAASAQGCGAGLFGVSYVEMTATNVSVAGIAAEVSAAVVNVTTEGARISLSDTAVWSEAKLAVGEEAELYVTREDGSVFEVGARKTSRATVALGVFAAASKADVHCTAAAMRTAVSIQGSGCDVALGSTSAEQRNVPATTVWGGDDDVAVTVDATVFNTSAASGSARAVVRAVGEQVEVTRPSGAKAVDVTVGRPGSALFSRVAITAVGSGMSTVASTDDAFVGAAALTLPTIVFEPAGSGSRLELVNVANGEPSRAVVEEARVVSNAGGAMRLEYCGDDGCSWTCYASSQCTARQLRADALFGGPCTDAPELESCAAAAQWRVVGAVSAQQSRDGLACVPYGPLVLGGDGGGAGGAFSVSLMGFVLGSACVCAIATLCGFVFAERGLDYGLNQVFGDRFGWARFVVFALVSRARLAEWSPTTVDAVAAAYQAVANLGGVQCAAVSPAPKQDTMWRNVAAGLASAACVGAGLAAASHVLARRRFVGASVVARLARALLGLAMFVLVVPALANALRSGAGVVVVATSLVLLALGLVLDTVRTRVVVVMTGAHLALDSPDTASKAVAGLGYLLTFGAAVSAAVLGGRSQAAVSISVSLGLWTIAAAGELVAPVWNVVQGGQRRVLALHAVVTTTVSAIVGGVALFLLRGHGPLAVVALWGIAFWGQWLSTAVLAVRGRSLDAAVLRERRKMLRGGRWSIGVSGVDDEADGTLPLLAARGFAPVVADVTEDEPTLN